MTLRKVLGAVLLIAMCGFIVFARYTMMRHIDVPNWLLGIGILVGAGGVAFEIWSKKSGRRGHEL
ncbi:hypothetical protein [Actinomadura parmotrematis]|uniref:DUF3188 domain-containing protein n=1 Tax=Actinomadura parmotrematis TaxID=2864039 RepID=A0ABS7FWM8_9ACTN|nr:hypothetical protein [Actinomadura parmotrematis]MBW8484835.1 hypothetical protein [Actinomadura parmotrematis]